MEPGETISGREARARRLFESVVGAPEAERATILSAARRDQPSTCAEVEALLSFHDRGSALLDRPASEAAAVLIPAGAREEPPARIGKYRIVREIGRGGMGVVYEADQEFPRRRVAVKVVRPELVTPSLLRRFTHEAEALAALQHPGIAQLFEAGFADGEARRRPFMAMELVPGGRTLAAHARETGAGVPERLELLARVCDAVEHAHRRGVIHRDLKPANILVVGDQPKVLDFGVARLTGADAPDYSMTSVGQIIGTLGYMSSEQIAGDPRAVDSRSDVYALGAMLYELLAERPAIDITGLNVTQAALALRDRRAPALGRVDTRFRGDLETIAAKALEKDPSRRYQSAAELGSDLRRYMAGEPIAARRDSALYILRKQLRRYRWGVGAAAAFLALIAGVAVWAAASAASYRRLAASEGAAKAEAMGARAALSTELRTSNLERARLLVESGAAPDGESLIWSEHVKDPTSADTLWALRDTYAKYPCRAALIGHASPTEAVAFSPDGSLVMSGDRAGGLRVWDARTGACVRAMQGPPKFVRAIAVLADNRTAFVSTSDGVLTQWDLGRGASVKSVVAHVPSRFWLAASPDGALLATAGPVAERERGVRLWSTRDLELVGELGVQRGALAHVAFSGDGSRLLTSGVDGFRVWNVATRILEGHAAAGNLLCAALSPDGSRIAAGAIGGAVTIWDAATLELVGQIGRESEWDVRAVAFTPNGRLLFADTWNIQVCDAADKAAPERIAPCSAIIAQLAVSGDGMTVATTAGDRAVRLWDLSPDRGRMWLEPPEDSRGYLHLAAVTGDGGLVAVVNDSGVINLWRGSDLAYAGSISGPRGRVFDLAFSRDATRLASGTTNGRVRVWDVATRALVADFAAHNCVSNLRFSPDGGVLATAGIDGRVALWETVKWTERARLVTGGGEARMVRFTPDGSLLLANNRSGALHFVDPADGAILATMRDETAYWGLDVSPDGTRFALADGTRAVRVYELARPLAAALGGEGEPEAHGAARVAIHELLGHREIVWSVAYSPDGALLASASGDGMLKVWDAERGRCLMTLSAQEQGFLFPLQFLPGPGGVERAAHRVVTGHGHRGAAIWDLAFFDRALAGNAAFQLERLAGSAAPEALERTRAWAGLSR